MINMPCTNNNDGICCEHCPAGKYVQVGCNEKMQTKCDSCKPGTYTATTNYLPSCRSCHDCSPFNKLRTVSNCTTEKNTVCECETGYFCIKDECDHCQKLRKCPPGEGVKVKATRTTDTVCAKCEEGTYSNVTDYSSPCITHTSCENYGRELKTPGSLTTDVVCGNFKSRCSWMLPAGLWSGLVLTILIVAVFIFWRARCKSRRADNSRVPVTLVDIVPPTVVNPPDLSSHCQESCPLDGGKVPPFSQDDPIDVCSIKDSFDSSVTMVPIKVSFAKSNHFNGSGGNNKGNFFRLHSEPQEDEWCGVE